MVIKYYILINENKANIVKKQQLFNKVAVFKTINYPPSPCIIVLYVGFLGVEIVPGLVEITNTDKILSTIATDFKCFFIITHAPSNFFICFNLIFC